MSFAAIEKIADAVLYEGYILYPYRPSAIKNQQRWNFGTLYPREFVEQQKPVENFSFHTEVLVEGAAEWSIDLCFRFLQIVPAGDDAGWDEGFARSRTLEGFKLEELCNGLELTLDLSTPSKGEWDRVPGQFHARAEKSIVAGLVMRAAEVQEGLYRVGITLANESHVLAEDQALRRMAQANAFTSAHLLLQINDGQFVSLLDPQPEFVEAVAACRNTGVFPVLAGEDGDRSRMLCSPIILYDYPQVAPESMGNFFDGTEMDEMLALRVMTLTDEEKAEMRRSDPHARAILERTETVPNEQMLKVHGAVRGMRTVMAEQAVESELGSWDPFPERPAVEVVRIFGVDVRCGDRVRLWPQKTADIMDMAMKGKVAIIEAIEQDLEDNLQLAVVLEDDPGRDMGMLRQTGHRFFFSPDEVEPLGMEAL
jgi:hypothetical protein